MVEPFALLEVEARACLAAAVKVEQPDQLVHRHDFLVIARIPSQQSQKVDDRLGQVT